MHSENQRSCYGLVLGNALN